MKAKIIEINGRLYMTVGGVIQYECDEKGNRKEQIMFEKEAQRSFAELDDRGVGDDWSIEESYVNGFSNGAEFGYNKAWEELKAQIEKMKCCRNCKYDGGLVCLYKTDYKNRDKWELAD